MCSPAPQRHACTLPVACIAIFALGSRAGGFALWPEGWSEIYRDTVCSVVSLLLELVVGPRAMCRMEPVVTCSGSVGPSTSWGGGRYPLSVVLLVHGGLVHF